VDPQFINPIVPIEATRDSLEPPEPPTSNSLKSHEGFTPDNGHGKGEKQVQITVSLEGSRKLSAWE
jgi:hypothetical protein